MPIYLDPRMGSGDLLPLISPQPVLTLLESGDAMAPGYGPSGAVIWGVEIKKLGDALSCMADGRLVTQLRKMHEDYDYVYFLLEDDIRCDPKTGNLQRRLSKKQASGKWSEFWVDAMFGNKQIMQYTTFAQWLMSVQLQGGARLLRSRDRQETAAWIGALYRTFVKPWDEHKSMKQFDTSSKPSLVKPSVAAEVAHALAPGVGWERAMAAAKHFGSVRAMLEATEKQWKEVPGIGKEIARRIVESINGVKS
jgi:ERCC4-type nuclease